MLIAPSVLSADFTELGTAIRMLNRSAADWIHVDVMDGNFVPNISFGLPICEAIARIAQKPLDVHLMIEKPERYLDDFKKAGASLISVHYEACTHLHRTVQHIKSLGCRAGVAINPHTSIHLLEDVIADLDLVCVMSVNPGFGGQHFIENTFHKIRQLKTLITEKKSQAFIEVDGGVNGLNAQKLMEAGADVLVAGNFVFKSENPLQAIAELKQMSEKTSQPSFK